MKIGLDTNGLKGGPEAFMVRLQRELKRQGLYDADSYDVWLHTTVNPLPERVVWRAKKNKCKIVIRSAGPRNIDFAAFFFGRLIPCLNGIINRPLNFFFNRHLLSNIYKAPINHVIYQSEYAKQLVEYLMGVTPVPNSIILNGVDLESFCLRHKSRDITEKGFPRIIMTGYFKPQKRIQQSPSIIRRLKLRYPQIQVIVAGGGFRDTLDELRRQIAANQVEQHYKILGQMHFDALPELYRTCDLMLFLSYHDACPNVVIEAIASGLPVVYTKTSGVPEIVADAGIGVNENIETNKRYVPHFNYKHMPQIDPDDYVNAIQELLDNYEDYRDKAIARREMFSIERVSADYIKVMEDLERI
ncbi:MAG: glycosyltransferase family 4 protein [Planctomycetota bacterium]|jgi:glycosyltransferase involved in cell wall biosynthesis